MAKVDHESAWLELANLVASREGWGSNTLLAEMQKIAAKHEISETFLERALRMYGGHVTVQAAGHVMSTAERSVTDGEGTSPASVAPAPGPLEDREVANGSSTREPAHH